MPPRSSSLSAPSRAGGVGDGDGNPPLDDPDPFAPSDLSFDVVVGEGRPFPPDPRSDDDEASFLDDPHPHHRTRLILREKVVVVGDAAVGKTALIRNLASGGRDFPKDYVMNTCGAELTVVEVPIPDTDATVDLFLYDTAGQSVFNQVRIMEEEERGGGDRGPKNVNVNSARTTTRRHSSTTRTPTTAPG